MEYRKRKIAVVLMCAFTFFTAIGAIGLSVQAKEAQTEINAGEREVPLKINAEESEAPPETKAQETTQMQPGAEENTTTSEKIALDTLVYADAQDKVYTETTLGEFPYTGAVIKPDLKIKNGDVVLAEGTDYIVTYERAETVPGTSTTVSDPALAVPANQNAGAVTMRITAVEAGNYSGEKTFTFQITPKSIQEVTIDSISDKTYSGNKKTPEPVIKDGEKTLVRKVDFKRSYTNNINAGIGTVKVTGIGNYTGVRELNFVIDQKDIYYLSYSSVSGKIYEGAAITPEVIVKSTARTLVKDMDYTLSYVDNNRVGTAGIIFTGIGNYKGSKIITFTVHPKSVSLLQLQKGKRKIKVKWTKETAGTTGYQIQYAAGRNFSSVKNIFVGKNKTAKMIKKLKGKKRYYIRVRTYTSVAGLKYYSSWSNIKSVKTKR